MYKFCVSGPAASGKTFCIKNYLDRSFDLVAVDESSRKVYSMYPELPSSDIRKFREKICEVQHNMEMITDNLVSQDGIVVYDRGVLDNLTFLLLDDGELFHSELNIVLEIYKEGYLSPYYKVIYFDVDLTDGVTKMLTSSLEDPLRKSTIDTNNYLKHVSDFKKAFLYVVDCLKEVVDLEVVTFISKPTEQDFDLRNKQVVDCIINSI